MYPISILRTMLQRKLFYGRGGEKHEQQFFKYIASIFVQTTKYL